MLYAKTALINMKTKRRPSDGNSCLAAALEVTHEVMLRALEVRHVISKSPSKVIGRATWVAERNGKR